MVRIVLTTAAAVIGMHAPTLLAQAYPAKPVRVIVPFPAGSGVDLAGRLVTPRLADALGQQFVVDNRGGAAGTIGAELAAKAPADGYTLLVMPQSLTISQTLYRKLGYDLARDFAPVAMIGSVPFVLVVHPSVPARSVKELVALARARPGQILFASTGNGSSPHLTAELFKSQARIDVVHVPYKGSPPALTDLVAGQVAFMFGNSLSTLPLIQAGRLRALAVSSIKRAAALPELPTVAEAGLPGFDSGTWFGLLAPTGTPADIIQRLNAETGRILRVAEVRERFIAQGGEPMIKSPEEFGAFIRAELDKWGKAVRASGAKID